MSDEPLYRLSDHAREEAERRGISLDLVDTIMRSPGQVINAHLDRRVYQSKVKIGNKLYLVRVIVEQSEPLLVITVYRTSKIDKYWSDNA